MLGACTADPTPAPPGSEASAIAEHAERSDELLADTLPADEPGCAAAVGVEGEVVWAGARGLADLSTGQALDTSTTFDIGSVSKQVTATAVLLLAQDGSLSLDDPLSRWVPGLPAWADAVTVADLVHHTSGIPDYTERLANDGRTLADRATQRETVASLAAVGELRAPPGERFEYSNSNYVLLAEVVREASGRLLPEFARERVFEPLELGMAVDPSGASPDDADPSSARSYVRGPVEARWQPAGSRWEQLGDGSVQTTSSDLVRWADNYRTGRVGGDELLAAQLEGAADAGDGLRYGAGIFAQRDGSLWHRGQWAGFLSEFWVSADRRTAVAVTCNGDRGPSSAVNYLAPALQREWR